MSLAQTHRKISFNASLSVRGVLVRKVSTGDAPIEFNALINDLGFSSQDFTIESSDVHATELHVLRGTPGLDRLKSGDVMQEFNDAGEVVREHTIRKFEPEQQKIVLKCTVEGE